MSSKPVTATSRPTVQPSAPGGHSLRFEGRATRDAQRFAFVADVDLLPPARGFRAVQGRRVDATDALDARALVVGFDATAWLSQIDWDALAQLAQDPVVITPDSKAANAIVIAIAASAPPTFRFLGDTP